MSETNQAGPWSILYLAERGEYSQQVYKAGPFASQQMALGWAADHDLNSAVADVESEFDILEDRVYVIGPDHQLAELTAADLGVTE